MRNYCGGLFLMIVVCINVNAQNDKESVPDSVKSRLIADFLRIGSSIRSYIEAMPEADINFKPTPDSRSFAEAMLHIAQANFNMAAVAGSIKNPHDFLATKQSIESMDRFKTKQALLTVVDECFEYSIKSLTAVPAPRLQEEFVWFKRKVTLDIVFRKALEHSVFLQGQTMMYLKLKGVKVPTEKLY